MRLVALGPVFGLGLAFGLWVGVVFELQEAWSSGFGLGGRS